MKTVLLIDDEAPIRANLKRFLELEGFRVLEAENGVEGMAQAMQNVADLIVCDVMMPEMNGFELLARLRGSLGWQEVPFLFLSASAEMDCQRHGIALGAEDYMTKPFNLMEVIARIRSRLGQ
jgi:DNA-binding response OmpR family regulator